MKFQLLMQWCNHPKTINSHHNRKTILYVALSLNMYYHILTQKIVRQNIFYAVLPLTCTTIYEMNKECDDRMHDI